MCFNFILMMHDSRDQVQFADIHMLQQTIDCDNALCFQFELNWGSSFYSSLVCVI